MLQGQRLDEAVVQPGGKERLGFLGNEAAGAALAGGGGSRGLRAAAAGDDAATEATQDEPAVSERMRSTMAAQLRVGFLRGWGRVVLRSAALSKAVLPRPGVPSPASCASRLLSEVGVVIARGVSTRASAPIGRPLAKATSLPGIGQMDAEIAGMRIFGVRYLSPLSSFGGT